MLIGYMEPCCLGCGRTGRMLVYMHVCIWMCHCLVYNAPWHHRNYTLACYSTIMAITYDTALRWCWSDIWNGIILALDEQYVRWYWCMFNFECDTLVSVHVWIGINVQLLGIWCTVTPSQLHTRLLFKYNGKYVRYGSAVMLIGYIERYYVGFGRTESTLVPESVWIGMCNCLVYNAPWPHRNCTLACYSNIIAIAYDTALRWCWSDIWNGIVLAVDEQPVRWYRSLFESECDIAWYTMHHDTIAIAHPLAIQI